jgi:hypothetical protein
MAKIQITLAFHFHHDNSFNSKAFPTPEHTPAKSLNYNYNQEKKHIPRRKLSTPKTR